MASGCVPEGVELRVKPNTLFNPSGGYLAKIYVDGIGIWYGFGWGATEAEAIATFDEIDLVRWRDQEREERRDRTRTAEHGPTDGDRRA